MSIPSSVTFILFTDRHIFVSQGLSSLVIVRFLWSPGVNGKPTEPRPAVQRVTLQLVNQEK